MKNFKAVIISILFIASVAIGASITDDILKLGTPGSASNKVIDFGDGLRKIRANQGSGILEFTNDDSTYTPLGGAPSTEFVGQGLFNAIDNSQIETDTTGYATYADAAAATPVDGTGGSPTVTLSQETGSPIRETGSLRLTKDAANRQGEGISYDFTIEPADLSRVMQISFEYLASANYADDDISVFIYNVDGASLITPLFNELKDGNGTYAVYFDADAANTNYRLVFHVASTSALSYTVDFDNIRVSTLPRDQTVARNIEFTKLHYYEIANSGTPTVARDPSGVVVSLDDNGPGDIDINYAAGTWDALPFCLCTSRQGAIFCVATVTNETVTSTQIQSTVHTGTLQDANMRVFCLGR